MFGRFRWQYERLLEHEALPGCRTLPDVRCGADSPIRRFSRRLADSVGIDRFKPASFDCVLASDVIEHLDKPDRLRLLRSMERIARRRVVVFTPNGFQPQGAIDGNEAQRHRSGWTVTEMVSHGYRVTGVNGWKPLRSERAEPRRRPRPPWGRVSYLTQPLTTRRPDLACQMLSVKDV